MPTGMNLDALKTQVMTMLMLKSQRPGQDDSGYGAIFVIVYTILLMNGIEWVFRQLPVAGKWVSEWLTKKASRTMQDTPLGIATVPNAERRTSSITMVRSYPKEDDGVTVGTTSSADPRSPSKNAAIEKIDVVIDHICSLDAAYDVTLDTRYHLNTKEEIVVTPDIKARVTNDVAQTDAAADTSARRVVLVLYSETLCLKELRAWIDGLHDAYCIEKNNKLGDRLYFFAERAVDTPTQLANDEHGNRVTVVMPSRMPPVLAFTMYEFKTNKSFSNVYGSHMDNLKARLNLFMNDPGWYARRGIPHTLGILLHGIPGAGKTSTIKAIARDTNSHIVTIALRKYTTEDQLMALFHSDMIVVDGGGRSGGTQYRIPQSRRLIVIEDIDALTDVTLDRRLRNAEAEKKEVVKLGSGKFITLGFLLNLLDGMLEVPGRKLVITTNHPERLDPALLRPGRLDVKIGFGCCTRACTAEMINGFFDEADEPVRPEDLHEALEGTLAPAEVIASLSSHYVDRAAAIQDLERKALEVVDAWAAEDAAQAVEEAAQVPEEDQDDAGDEKEVASGDPGAPPSITVTPEQDTGPTETKKKGKDPAPPSSGISIQEKHNGKLRPFPAGSAATGAAPFGTPFGGRRRNVPDPLRGSR
jgi:hypothetical protein